MHYLLSASQCSLHCAVLGPVADMSTTTASPLAKLCLHQLIINQDNMERWQAATLDNFSVELWKIKNKFGQYIILSHTLNKQTESINCEDGPILHSPVLILYKSRKDHQRKSSMLSWKNTNRGNASPPFAEYSGNMEKTLFFCISFCKYFNC